MAPIYRYDPSKVLPNPDFVVAPPTLAKLDQALAAKNVPAAHRGRFTAHVAGYDFAPLKKNAVDYIQKNLKGKSLVGIPQGKWTETVIKQVVLSPQVVVLRQKFDLSVHVKGNAAAPVIEMWHVDCKGTKHVLFSVP